MRAAISASWPGAGAVLQVQVESVGDAELEHGRRREREHHGVAQLGKRRHRTAGDRLHGVARAGSLLPVLEPHEGDAGILAAAGKREAGDREQRLHRLLFVLQEVPLRLAQDRKRALLRRPGRKNDLGKQDPLIFVGQERRRQPQQQECGERDHHGVSHEPAPSGMQHPADDALIQVAAPFEEAIEPPEESPRGAVRPLFQRREQRGAKRR